MSKAYKCDFCGRFYEFYRNKHGFNAIRFIEHNDGKVNTSNGKAIDLCPNCMDKLYSIIYEKNYIAARSKKEEEHQDADSIREDAYDKVYGKGRSINNG